MYIEESQVILSKIYHTSFSEDRFCLRMMKCRIMRHFIWAFNICQRARHIYPSLVLVQPRKTRPCLAERLLMGRKESNQTNLGLWHLETESILESFFTIIFGGKINNSFSLRSHFLLAYPELRFFEPPPSPPPPPRPRKLRCSTSKTRFRLMLNANTYVQQCITFSE